MAARKRVATADDGPRIVDIDEYEPAPTMAAPRKRAPGRPRKSAVSADAQVVPVLDDSIDAWRSESKRASARRGAPSVYTVQMSLILDAETGGRLRADITHQQKKDPTRTQAVVLREIFDRGLAELRVDWQARGFIASDRARKAAVAVAREPRTRAGTLRAVRAAANGDGST
jgi:hypothetical protein